MKEMMTDSAQGCVRPGQKVALVTGAFSGIGQATTLVLAQSGWTVYAAGRHLARSDELLARARQAGATVCPIGLDVTDEGSIANAMSRIEREAGRLDVLVNNAGVAVHGAVTETSNDQIRQQFETNVIGVVATSRAALELMRRHRQGRIINVGSVLGKMAFPGSGIYCASKFALEGLSDAMRLELKLVGPDFHVIVIESPKIKTRLGDNATFAAYGGQPDSLYGCLHTLVQEYVAHAYNVGPEPEVVAKAVLEAACARRPRTRYVVTSQAHVVLALRRVLPDRVFDALLLTQTPRFRKHITARERAARLLQPRKV